MGLKLKDFRKVIKNKSKEEVLIDTSYTLPVCLNDDDQGSRPCGYGGGARPCTSDRSPKDDANIIGKLFFCPLLTQK